MKSMKNSLEFQQICHNIVRVSQTSQYVFIFRNFSTDIPDHMAEDMNQISHPSGVPLVTPPFSHLTHQNQHPMNTMKKEDDHIFLHPSIMGDPQRRMQDTYLNMSNNGNNTQQQQTASVCIIEY